MALKADDVYQAGLALDLDERAVVAHRLLDSLHPQNDAAQPDVDAAWRDEISVRVDDVLQGRVELLSYDEVRAAAHELLNDLRQ
jgi:putative addiction module component (TIGR02574 family)